MVVDFEAAYEDKESLSNVQIKGVLYKRREEYSEKLNPW